VGSQLFLFFKGAILIGPSAIFLGTLGMPPIEVPFWTPNCKIGTNVHPWISPCLVYILGVELWANHTGEDPGAIGNVLGNASRNSLGTYPCPCPPQKIKRERNWIIHECMVSLLIACVNCLFPKLLVTIFGLG
jgi:hypothetical protein